MQAQTCLGKLRDGVACARSVTMRPSNDGWPLCPKCYRAKLAVEARWGKKKNRREWPPNGKPFGALRVVQCTDGFFAIHDPALPLGKDRGVYDRASDACADAELYARYGDKRLSSR